MAKYMDQSGAQHFAEALMSATKTVGGQSIWGTGNIEAGSSVISTTYSAFKADVENGELTPGALYMITDYQAVPNATHTKKDPMIAVVADTYLIIQALTQNAYDENASLVEVQQTGVEPVIDVYNVKYTIENKYYIDQDSGRGTITYMRDVASGNAAPWDWRMGKGIVSIDATKTTFTNCNDCTIACDDHNNEFPCITLDSCSDCNIGPDNSNIDLQNCQRVNIKELTSNIYLQYVYDCNIGCGCDNIHIGDGTRSCGRVNIKNDSSDIYLLNVHDCNIGCRCGNIHMGDDSGYKVQYMNIGDNCSYIFVLPPENDVANNVIGNNCRYVQFAGSGIVIGNNCDRIYLSGYTGGYIQTSNDVTVGNNCSCIGRNLFFSDFNSFIKNDMHFDYCSIGDNCGDIRSSAVNISSSYYCSFSRCSFQGISGFYIKPPTTGVSISYKIFKNISAPIGFPLDTSASLPTNWKTTRGDISYDADSHRFAFRRPTDSTWTDIH